MKVGLDQEVDLDQEKRGVIRGGSRGFSPIFCRSAFRLIIRRVNRSFDSGFRIVCVSGRTLQ